MLNRKVEAMDGLRGRTILGALFLVAVLMVEVSLAQARPASTVSPVMEIEVISPKQDSVDNPAIRIEQGQVEIPPVLMVHRYYYSGDRSFQGPMLPGGPTVLVANHPKTGERVYVPAQMMPGAPHVTYTKRGITYDYGENAIALKFRGNKAPVIEYRSGTTLKQKVGHVLKLDEFKETMKNLKAWSKDCNERSRTTLMGMSADLKEVGRIVTVPATNVLQSLPFGKMAFSGDLEQYYAERAAQLRLDRAAMKAARSARLRDSSIRTIR